MSDIDSRVVSRWGLFLLFLPGLAAAVVSFPAIRTRVELSAEGEAHVVQELTCRFEGRSHQMRLTYLASFSGSQVTLNRLTEQSARSYGAVEDVDTATVDGALVVKWNPRAREETRHYLADLTVAPAVRRYEDAARVRVSVLGRAPGPVELATVELRLPIASTGRFEFTQGEATEVTVSPDRKTARLTRTGIEEGERLGISAVTDAGVFNRVTRREGTLDGAESKPLYDDYVQQVLGGTESPRWYLALVPLLLPLVLLLVLYLLYGREPRVGYHARYEHEPPDRIPPLAVPSIMRQQPELTELPLQTLDATLATLVDAARKGVLDILYGDTPAGQSRGFRMAHPEKLSELDDLGRRVVDYYFCNVSGGRDFVTGGDIRRHAAEQPDAFWFWLKQMSQEGRDWWWKKLRVGFLEPASSRAYRTLCCIAPPVTALGCLALPFVSNVFSFIVSWRLPAVLFLAAFLLSGVVYARLGRVILRWSPPAYYEHLRWLSFRRFLVEFSAIEQAPIELSAIWQEYYVYAVALGIGQEFMRGLSSLATTMSWGAELLEWESLEGLGVGNEFPCPGLHTREAVGQGVSLLIEELRSGTGIPGRRADRLRSLVFWRVGRD